MEQVKLYKTLINEPTFKRNYAAKQAHGKYLAFFDDDIEVFPCCVDKMAGYLDKHQDVGMVYALLYRMGTKEYDTTGCFLSWTGFLYETYTKPKHPIPVMASKSACCMIRRDLFFKLGGFDKDFVIYGEETDLSWRVWLAGYKVMMLPQAKAFHAFETQFKPRSYYNNYYIHYHGSKNYVTMLIKNLGWSRMWIANINWNIWLVMGIAMWFKNRKASKWILQGCWYNVTHLGYILSKRRRTQELRKVKDRQLFSQFFKNPPVRYYFQRFFEYLTHQLHG